MLRNILRILQNVLKKLEDLLAPYKITIGFLLGITTIVVTVFPSSQPDEKPKKEKHVYQNNNFQNTQVRKNKTNKPIRLCDDSSYNEKFLKDGLIISRNTKSGKCNLKNIKTGIAILPSDYDYIVYFNDNLVSLYRKNREGYKLGLFNKKTRKFILNVEYDGIEPFDNNFIKVMKREKLASNTYYQNSLYEYKYGLIDKEGNFIIEVEYNDIEDFGQNLIKTTKRKVNNNSNNNPYGSKNLYFQKSYNKQINKNPYNDYNLSYSTTYNSQYNDNISYEYKLFFRSGKGINPIGEPVYDDIKKFDTDFILVQKRNLYGLIDKKNRKVIVKPEYNKIYKFKKDRARFIKGNKYGFFDKQGKEVVPAIFNDAEDFEDGDFARVKQKNRLFFINKKGDIIKD